MNQEIEIPEGCEAKIEGNKVILVPKESEDERIGKELLNHLKQEKNSATLDINREKWSKMLAYLERLQKEQKPAEWSEDIRNWKNIAYYVLKEWLGIGQYLDNPALDKIAKELQKRYGPVNHISISEWSKDDKAMLVNVLGTYKTFEGMLDLSTEQDRDILESMDFERDWLKDKFKSLHPQSE